MAGIRKKKKKLFRKVNYSYSEQYNVKDVLLLWIKLKIISLIEIFEKVIEQSPLDKDAELSHICLIMIYDELGDKVNLHKHIKQLKEDFPDSSVPDSLPLKK